MAVRIRRVMQFKIAVTSTSPALPKNGRRNDRPPVHEGVAGRPCRPYLSKLLNSGSPTWNQTLWHKMEVSSIQPPLVGAEFAKRAVRRTASRDSVHSRARRGSSVPKRGKRNRSRCISRRIGAASTEEQIAFVLHYVDTGKVVEEVCRNLAVSQVIFYAWKL